MQHHGTNQMSARYGHGEHRTAYGGCTSSTYICLFISCKWILCCTPGLIQEFRLVAVTLIQMVDANISAHTAEMVIITCTAQYNWTQFFWLNFGTEENSFIVHCEPLLYFTISIAVQKQYLLVAGCAHQRQFPVKLNKVPTDSVVVKLYYRNASILFWSNGSADSSSIGLQSICFFLFTFNEAQSIVPDTYRSPNCIYTQLNV